MKLFTEKNVALNFFSLAGKALPAVLQNQVI